MARKGSTWGAMSWPPWERIAPIFEVDGHKRCQYNPSGLFSVPTSVARLPPPWSPGHRCFLTLTESCNDRHHTIMKRRRAAARPRDGSGGRRPRMGIGAVGSDRYTRPDRIITCRRNRGAAGGPTRPRVIRGAGRGTFPLHGSTDGRASMRRGCGRPCWRSEVAAGPRPGDRLAPRSQSSPSPSGPSRDPSPDPGHSSASSSSASRSAGARGSGSEDSGSPPRGQPSRSRVPAPHRRRYRRGAGSPDVPRSRDPSPQGALHVLRPLNGLGAPSPLLRAAASRARRSRTAWRAGDPASARTARRPGA
jgi:hypothetical protein